MRPILGIEGYFITLFQSTHPVRGATHGDDSDAAFELFQSTHPVRGATKAANDAAYAKAFQSTHPVRGATGDFDVVFQDDTISIHAPREGCD